MTGMTKYINADQFERDCMFDRECEDMQDVIYKLRDYPSADVVEIIRCKDCKYYIKPTTNPHDNSDWYMCKFFDHLMDDNDFCSSGERKTE